MDMSDYELQQRDIELLKSMAIQDWKRQFDAWEDLEEDDDMDRPWEGGVSGTYWGQ